MADFLIKILDSSGKEVFADTNAGIDEFIVSYSVNAFPTGVISLSTKSFNELLPYRDLTVGIELYDGSIARSYEFYVSNADITDETAVLSGKLTKSINDTYKMSRYLGKDTKTAIEALNFYQRYTSDINLTNGYYMINETAVSALHKILQYSSMGKLYCITNDSIYFVDPRLDGTPVRNISNLSLFEVNNLMHLIPFTQSNNSTGPYIRKFGNFSSIYKSGAINGSSGYGGSSGGGGSSGESSGSAGMDEADVVKYWDNEVTQDGYYKSSDKFHVNINYDELISYYPGQVPTDYVKNSMMMNKFLYDVGIASSTGLDNFSNIHLGDRVSSILHYGDTDKEFTGFVITAINESYSNEIKIGLRVGCYFSDLIEYIESDIPFYKEELIP